MKLKIGIIGAAGLSAGKLLEILSRHPNANVVTSVSESSPGVPIASAHPQLRGVIHSDFDQFNFKKLRSCDVVFSCKKAGETFPFINDILEGKTRFIDLSGDYRLNSADFETWYGIKHQHTTHLNSAVYGLPEMNRKKIEGAKLVANPGCYTTTSILACAPFVAAGYGKRAPIIIDAISGISGAGRSAKSENLFISVSDNVRAYRVGNHQHTPEIEQALNEAGKRTNIKVLFVPHVGPFSIGIMANCYFRSEGTRLDKSKLHAIISRRYAHEPFVRVHENGSLPQISDVVGTNFCDIGVTYDSRTGTIVVISVTDNLIKGAAGQAVQNMNIMFGLRETAGLL